METKGLSRRSIELFLLILSMIPTLALYTMYAMTAQLKLPDALIEPIALCIAFLGAHIAVRILAPAADPAILPIVSLLSGIGITFVTRLAPDLAMNQLLWLFLSIAAMVTTLVAVPRLSKLSSYKYSLGAAGVVLLLIPMLIGVEHGGSKLWIQLGPVSFQPGELAKICIVLFLSFYLAQNREALSLATRSFGPFKIPPFRMVAPVLVMWGMSLLLVVFERDLGSALLFFTFFVIMIYTATGRVSYVVISILLLAVGAVFCYRFFGHVQNRVNIWLDPFADASGGGYQIVQSLYSLADGDLIGTGIDKGLPTLIPVVESDFIFSAIGEEMGLFGGCAIIMLFMLLTVRGFATAARAKTDAAAFAAVGLTAALAFQAFLIIAGVTKLLPLTGVTLPFMSQGGSSLLSSFIIVALLLRAGDEGTGHEAQISDEPEMQKAERAQQGAGHMRVPVKGSNKLAAFFTYTTPESGVLGRVALSKRLQHILSVFTLIFAVLIANLTYIQIINADKLQNMPANNHTIAKSSYVQRGSIITADGVTLAESQRQSDGTYQRVYPQGAMAAHTVGYISTQFGTTGIESSKNEVLTGHTDYSSWKEALYSLAGVAQPGNTVQLTINSQMQKVVENALAPYTGAVVLMDPSTGAVLAKASTPSYNNSDLSSLVNSGSNSNLLDRTTQALYTPGSTFKTVSLAAALDAGLTNLNDTYKAPAELTIGGAAVTNYGRNDYGTVSLKKGFAYSSNTVFAQVGAKLGPELLVKYADAFGFGSPLGQDFTTAASLMPKPEEMTEWETAWAAVGQPVGQHASPAGPQVTIMQNALIASTIANGGVAMNPYVVSHILSPEGTITSTTQPASLGRVISQESADKVKEAMLDVVESGEGRLAAVSGVKVAGKTGTAEVDGVNINSLFIGFAPYDTPTIAISVVIEGDGDNVQGVAAKISGQILAQCLKIQSLGAGSQ